MEKCNLRFISREIVSRYDDATPIYGLQTQIITQAGVSFLSDSPDMCNFDANKTFDKIEKTILRI